MNEPTNRRAPISVCHFLLMLRSPSQTVKKQTGMAATQHKQEAAISQSSPLVCKLARKRQVPMPSSSPFKREGYRETLPWNKQLYLTTL